MGCVHSNMWFLLYRLKCNRAVPCENCVKRGDAPSCVYAQNGTRKRNLTNQSASSSPDDMQNRIDRLEGLVMSIMTNGPQSAGTDAATAAISGTGSSSTGPNTQDVELNDGEMGADESDTDKVTKSLGIMKVDNNKSFYISDSHWASVLHEVCGLKSGYRIESCSDKLNADIRSTTVLCIPEEAIRGAVGESPFLTETSRLLWPCLDIRSDETSQRS